MTQTIEIPAVPFAYPFAPGGKTALVVIDMQRDFVEPGGFGEALGNDVTPLQAVIAPCRRMLDIARTTDMFVIHTREGHAPDLGDCPPSKRTRGRGKITIGDEGPMGRLLVRGQRGHEIVPELAPVAGEAVVDKPGKGAFFATDLDHILHNRGIKSLIVCGVTTEVCVTTTVREANDRGYECVVLQDCVGSYFPQFQRAALDMIKAQGAIFGWVSDSTRAVIALHN
jgi:nicotinamidase-related amidase